MWADDFIICCVLLSKVLHALFQKVFNIQILLCKSAVTEQASVVVMLLDMYWNTPCLNLARSFAVQTEALFIYLFVISPQYLYKCQSSIR
jgi:hypothetical protein